MHGRVKVKAPEEIRAAREKEERALAKKFKENLDKVWEKRKADVHDDEALLLTGQILLQNADFVTVWNQRREILLHFKEAGEKDMEKIFSNELKFNSCCLVKHPKSYATWYHRQFVILSMKEAPFREEIQACDHFLDLDERNFHCWDYRRFICNYGKIDFQNELKFTQKKIGQNFSNFSSFYYRSSLLMIAHNEGIININDYWDSDYETIINAIFVDPNDQSPWFYHKWLLAADQLINYHQPTPETPLHKVMFDQSKCCLIYQFHQPLHDPPFESVSIVDHDDQARTIDINNWQKIGPISSYLWYHQIDDGATIDVLSFQYSEKQFTIDLPGLEFGQTNLKVRVVSPLPGVKTINTESKLDLDKMNNLKLLLEIEPENKWINLTMSSLNGAPNESAIEKLVAIDPIRSNYYKDQKSKQITQKRLTNCELSCRLILSDSNLTCLYFINHLTHLRFLDLSNNQFLKLSASFNALVALETLILDKNDIEMIDQELEMLSLQKLSLKSNRLKSQRCLAPLANCKSLSYLDVSDNPIKPGDELLIHVKINY